MPESNSAYGCKFLEWYKFDNAGQVPLYDVFTPGALSQLIGYAKFINRDYGNVYYRGVDALYPNVLPSVMRGRKNGRALGYKGILSKLKHDKALTESLKLTSLPSRKNPNEYHIYNKIKRLNEYKIEGLIQHYIGSTKCIDVVNNHWIALWMGLHDFIQCGERNQHVICSKRCMSLESFIEKMSSTGSTSIPSIYEYIVLIAMPHCSSSATPGVYETDELVEVDLRIAIPSFYLRPHAQHALVVRKRDNDDSNPNVTHYDLAPQVIGILRIRLDLADRWLGNGLLVSKDNLFPSPSIDSGLCSLLKKEYFSYPFEVKKYF